MRKISQKATFKPRKDASKFVQKIEQKLEPVKRKKTDPSNPRKPRTDV